MKQRLRSDYPSAELLESEVEYQQERARRRERLKTILLVVLALLWAAAVMR